MSDIKRNVLTGLQTFSLMTLIKEEYAKQALTDVNFAHYAEEQLGFPVSVSSVGSYRTQLGIPSTFLLRQEAKPDNVLRRLDALEAELARCMSLLAKLGGQR